jgi:hypothetical protein
MSSGNLQTIVAVYANVMNRRLFLHLKKRLAAKKFEDDDEVKEEVMTWFKGQAADFYDSEIQKLVHRLNKCLDNAGDYLKNKVRPMYRQFIQCRFCKLKMYTFQDLCIFTFRTRLVHSPSVAW